MNKSKIDKLITFLKASGAEVLEPTNPHEVVRFRTVNGVSIIYKKKNGCLTFTGEAEEAFEKMLNTSPWRIEPKGQVRKRNALREVMKRDGDDCFFCHKPTTDKTRTLEHLLAVAHGGNNNPANLVIACEGCNKTVGDLPIIEKIRFRERHQVMNYVTTQLSQVSADV